MRFLKEDIDPRTNDTIESKKLDELYHDQYENARHITVSPNAASFVRDIAGQMSDGYWENSPRMESYWKFFYVDGNDIIIAGNWDQYDEYSRRHIIPNLFKRMSDAEIKNFFADKIKYIVKAELKDNNEDPIANWNRNSDYELDYLHGTIADAYKAYDELKGRKIREGIDLDEALGLKEGVSGNMTIEEIAEKHKVPVEDIRKQLEIGVKVEKEHTDDEGKAERIALDHLFEIPNYYDKLAKMEKSALKESVKEWIYLFPELTDEDKDKLHEYDLIYLGKNYFENEVNDVVKGTQFDLRRYARNYLDYVLHPDYLYYADDFAGEIVSEGLKNDDIHDFLNKARKLGAKTFKDLERLSKEHEFNGILDLDRMNTYYKNANPDDKDLSEDLDISSLEQKIRKEIRKFYKSFDDDDYEEFVNDYLVVEIEDRPKDTKVEVRLEASYNTMDKIADLLNPIIQKLDKDAYFDHEDAGIINAFINKGKHSEKNIDEEAAELKEIEVPNYFDTWSSFDSMKVNGKTYYIMENDEWGDETFYLVITPDFEKIYETFDDIETCLRDEGILTDELDEKLIRGKSDATLKKNIATEIEAGKDPKQAYAIAKSIQKKNESFRVWGDEEIRKHNITADCAKKVEEVLYANDIKFDTVDYDVFDMPDELRVIGIVDANLQEVAQTIEDDTALNSYVDEEDVVVNISDQFDTIDYLNESLESAKVIESAKHVIDKLQDIGNASLEVEDIGALKKLSRDITALLDADKKKPVNESFEDEYLSDISDEESEIDYLYHDASEDKLRKMDVFDNLNNLESDNREEIIKDGKERWVKTEQDREVWDSLSDDDRYFLSMSDDMGFWFDDIEGNEDFERRYLTLRSKFSISNNDSDDEPFVDFDSDEFDFNEELKKASPEKKKEIEAEIAQVEKEIDRADDHNNPQGVIDGQQKLDQLQEQVGDEPIVDYVNENLTDKPQQSKDVDLNSIKG